MQGEIPRPLAIGILVVVVLFAAIGVFQLINRQQAVAPVSAAELQQTQAAEQPGDPPSGDPENAQPAHQNAD